MRATYCRWPKFDAIADFFGRYVVVKQLRFFCTDDDGGTWNHGQTPFFGGNLQCLLFLLRRFGGNGSPWSFSTRGAAERNTGGQVARDPDSRF